MWVLEREELFSRRVRAGRRVYFLDVKANQNNEKFLVISEKKEIEEGKQERHRVLVNPEDIDRFMDALSEVVKYLKDEVAKTSQVKQK